MKKIINKYNLSTFLFIIVSLAVLLIAVVAYILFNNPGNVRLANVQPEKGDRYFINENFKNDDPYITKVPSLKDMITGPIISTRDPSIGSLDAPVAIVQFSDFICQYCRRQEQVLKQALDKYQGQVVLIWKDYPEKNLESLSFQSSIAARCAQAQGQFWPFHDRLYEESNLSNDAFVMIAEELSLDITQFQNCFSSQSVQNLITDNIKEANALDISGIPFIYINTQEVMGEVSLSDLEKIINIELVKQDN